MIRRPVTTLSVQVEKGERINLVICDDGSVWEIEYDSDLGAVEWIEHEPIPETEHDRFVQRERRRLRGDA